jgi:hypothetical protein
MMSTPPDHGSKQPDHESLLKVYSEICDSYHAIDDFRMKLLGFLPLASVAGVLLLGKDMPAPEAKLIGYACFFASVFTLSLFLYEIRGIIRSDGLIKRGEEIEQLLNINGQFLQCKEEAQPASSPKLTDRIRRYMNTTVASCLIYSLVFAFWMFLALRFAYNIQVYGCALSAVGVGILIGVAAYLVVRLEVPA